MATLFVKKAAASVTAVQSSGRGLLALLTTIQLFASEPHAPFVYLRDPCKKCKTLPTDCVPELAALSEPVLHNRPGVKNPVRDLTKSQGMAGHALHSPLGALLHVALVQSSPEVKLS